MEPILLATVFLGFFCTFLLMPFWIKKAKQIGLVWEDMNKFAKDEKVAGSGGLMVLFGFLIGVLTYIAIKTFYIHTNTILVEIFALLASILFVGLVGFIDDLFGWRHGGLSVRSRIVLVFFAAIPLMVINAGEPTMAGINFGLFYPLIIIPLGIIGATTTFNFLAGFNGLEASQGIILLTALSIVTYLTGNPWLSVIALCMVASLIAFYIFNKYPAKVFPGDIMTYSIGALIAGIAILGNIEKIVLFFFIPYILETILKIRGGLPQSFGKPKEDNSLELLYGKVYGLTHLSIFLLSKFKKKVYEKDVVRAINLFQILIIILGFLIFL
ncbi:MAG: glycosyl transferase family 4 [Nanoarchaeota archaeon]|nr:glycosyl transferase family 4 [Nanoarchaeota archaeon]